MIDIILGAIIAVIAISFLRRKHTHETVDCHKNCDENEKFSSRSLPQHLEKYRKLYNVMGYPLKKCEDNSRSYPMPADSMSKIYGSKKAAVVYNPGCLNGANWRVCGLDDTGEYETFSMNIFCTKDHAMAWAKENGYSFEVYDYEHYFKSLSEKTY